MALAKIKSGASFAVVLMDCQMPIMDGYQASRAIREWERSRSVATPVPIVALTANAMPDDRDRCLQAGMTDYLSKPFSGNQLRAVVSRWASGTPDVGDGTNRKIAVGSPLA